MAKRSITFLKWTLSLLRVKGARCQSIASVARKARACAARLLSVRRRTGILSSAAAVIAEGEVLQLTTQNNLQTTETSYLEVIRAKTAELFAAASRIGAVRGEALPYRTITSA